MTSDKDSAVRQANREWEVSDFDDDREMADWARAWGVNLLEVASLRQPTQSEDKCVECNGNGYTEIIGGYEHTCEVCYGEGFLRQPTQSDALREALEAAPLIGRTESVYDFMERQEAWLKGPYRAAMQEQSK
jgi:hypothetical protein